MDSNGLRFHTTLEENENTRLRFPIQHLTLFLINTGLVSLLDKLCGPLLRLLTG